MLGSIFFIECINWVDLWKIGSPDRPPDSLINEVSLRRDLSIVVLDTINPEILNSWTASIIVFSVSDDSSGDILRNTGLSSLNNFFWLSIDLNNSEIFSLLCRSLRSGVFGDEILIVM